MALTPDFLFATIGSMKRRDIAVGIIILIVLAGVYYFRQKNQKVTPVVPSVISTEKSLEDKFKIQIPEDVSKAELKDVSGGNASGIVTRDFKNGKFESSVIADLPAPQSGEFYQAWLEKDGGTVLMGRLTSVKGGYMLDYNSKTDLTDHNKVKISLEKKSDKTPEKTVLEASF